MKTRKRKTCRCGAPALFLKDVCGICELTAMCQNKIEPLCGQRPKNWPRYSNAAAVSPDQVEKAMSIDKQLGVPTEYDAKGRPKFTSQAHQKAYAKAWKMVDSQEQY